MLLNGIANTQEYDNLLGWGSHLDSFVWMHTQKQFQLGEGFLVLEARERLLAFLVQYYQKWLHDIPAATITSNNYPINPEP